MNKVGILIEGNKRINVYQKSKDSFYFEFKHRVYRFPRAKKPVSLLDIIKKLEL